MSRHTKADTFMAFCWATGEIGFGHVKPDGCLPIAQHGDEAKLRGLVEAQARHAYPPSTALLVPGIPEAKDSEAKLDALHAFSDRIKEKL